MPRLLTQAHAKIVRQILLTKQLDLVQQDLIYLQERTNRGEIDLILDQPHKSTRQKSLFLEKVIAELHSPEVKDALTSLLHFGEFDLFQNKYFADFLKALQAELENMQAVSLQVAIDFRPADMRSMAKVVSHKLGRPVVFDVQVDRTLLGGAIIQIGSHIYDYSLRSRLGQFKESWEEALDPQAEAEPSQEA